MRSIFLCDKMSMTRTLTPFLLVLTTTLGCADSSKTEQDGPKSETPAASPPAASSASQSDVTPDVDNPPVATTTAETKPLKTGVIDTRYLLPKAGAVLVVRPQDILNTKLVADLLGQLPPGTDVATVAKQMAGLELANVESITMAWHSEADWYATVKELRALIVRVSRPFDLDAVRRSPFGADYQHAAKLDSTTYYMRRKPYPGVTKPGEFSLVPALCPIDDRTLVFGDESMIAQIIQADEKESPLINSIRSVEVAHPVHWFSNGDGTGRMLASLFPPHSATALLAEASSDGHANSALMTRLARIPEQLRPLAELLEREDSVFSVALDIEPEFQAAAQIALARQNDVPAASDAVKTGLAFVRSRLIEEREYLVKELAPLAGAAQLDTLIGLLQQPPRITPPSVVKFELSDSDELTPLLAGFVMKAARDARKAAQAAQILNDLRQIALAVHNYHDEHGRFPASANRNAKGKPLLSWRVHLLPHLNETELYEKFHLDEPWDSPHNKTLLARIPQIYRSIGEQADGSTFILGVEGPGAFFDGSKVLRWKDLSPLQERTKIMLVCVDDASAVPWTKPVDFRFNAANAHDTLRQHSRNRFQFAFIDGSVRRGDPAIFTPEKLKAAFTINAAKPSD